MYRSKTCVTHHRYIGQDATLYTVYNLTINGRDVYIHVCVRWLQSHSLSHMLVYFIRLDLFCFIINLSSIEKFTPYCNIFFTLLFAIGQETERMCVYDDIFWCKYVLVQKGVPSSAHSHKHQTDTKVRNLTKSLKGWQLNGKLGAD